MPFYQDFALCMLGNSFLHQWNSIAFFEKPFLKAHNLQASSICRNMDRSGNFSGVKFKAHIVLLKCMMQYYLKTHTGDMILFKFSTLQNMFIENPCYDVWSR